MTIGPGDVVHVAAGGSGGWGNPIERNPDDVVQDVKCGFVTPESARDTYGVVLENGSHNPTETQRLRDTLISNRENGEAFFDYGPERDEFESVWTNENYTALSDLLDDLPVHWRFFMKHRIFEAVADDPDGGSIRDRFAKIVEEFPELSRGLAS